MFFMFIFGHSFLLTPVENLTTTEGLAQIMSFLTYLYGVMLRREKESTLWKSSLRRVLLRLSLRRKRWTKNGHERT